LFLYLSYHISCHHSLSCFLSADSLVPADPMNVKQLTSEPIEETRVDCNASIPTLADHLAWAQAATTTNNKDIIKVQSVCLRWQQLRVSYCARLIVSCSLHLGRLVKVVCTKLETAAMLGPNVRFTTTRAPSKCGY
jgi:hypothetical protein